MKKWLSILLATVMLFSALTGIASGESISFPTVNVTVIGDEIAQITVSGSTGRGYCEISTDDDWYYFYWEDEAQAYVCDYFDADASDIEQVEYYLSEYWDEDEDYGWKSTYYDYEYESGKALPDRVTYNDYTYHADGSYESHGKGYSASGVLISQSETNEDKDGNYKRHSESYSESGVLIYKDDSIETADGSYESHTKKYTDDGVLTREYDGVSAADGSSESHYKYYSENGILTDADDYFYAADGSHVTQYKYFRSTDGQPSSESRYEYDTEGNQILYDYTSYHYDYETKEYTGKQVTHRESTYGKDGSSERITTGWSENADGEITERTEGKITEDANGNYKSESKEYDKKGTLRYTYSYESDKDDNNKSLYEYYDINGELEKKQVYSHDEKSQVTVGKTYGPDGYLLKDYYSTENSCYDREYDKVTHAMIYEYIRSQDSKGNSTYTYTYLNNDGSLRRKEVEEGDKNTFYNCDGQVEYISVHTYDEETGLNKTTFTDGAGKLLGMDGYDEDDNYCYFSVNINARTGKITQYTASKGNRTTTYNADGTEQNHSVGEYIADADKYITSTYYGDSKTPRYVDEFDYQNGVETYSRYSNAGEFIGSTVYDNDGVTKYYNSEKKLVYTSSRDPETGGSEMVYRDADGKEIGRDSSRSLYDDDGKYLGYESTSFYVSTNNRGYATGAEAYTWRSGDEYYDEINIRYDRNFTKESSQATHTTYTEKNDTSISTTVDGNGMVLRTSESKKDEYNGDTLRSVTNYYNARTGEFSSRNINYPEDKQGVSRYKNYDKHENFIYYGENYTDNGYFYDKQYYPDGTLKNYYWSENLEGGSYEYASYTYDSDGMLNYSYSRTDDVYAYSGYNDNGTLSYSSETQYNPDGSIKVRNYTSYDKNGNPVWYDWGRTYSEDWAYDTTIWNATAPLYTMHHEDAADGNGYAETWKDNAGNVKEINATEDDYTMKVTFANAAEGWNSAFDGEWYYVENGEPVTGWKQLGGVWYYFGEGGLMETGNRTIDNTLYVFNEDGSWNDGGWSVRYSTKSYVDQNGNAVTGWKMIDGKWYWFTDGWYLDTGWYGNETNWYQSSAGYAAMDGAQLIWNGDWTDQDLYFFNEDGTWDTSKGWKKYDNNYYYGDGTGNLVTGWKQIDGQWYYFAKDGAMRNGWVSSGSDYYYMNLDGTMATGWIQEMFEDDWYYLGEDGLLKTGWQEIDGLWYYLNEDGTMAKSQFIDGYYLDASGVMATGWQQIGGSWYYFGTSGKMTTGWLEQGGAWYYMTSEGKMVTGNCTIDGRVNIFDASGVWQGYGD